MKLFKDLFKVKNRLKLSVLGGLIGATAYIPVLIIYLKIQKDPFDIWNAFILPGEFLAVFLFFSGIIFILTSFIQIRKENLKKTVTQIIIPVIIVVFMSIHLQHKIRRSILYYASMDKTLDSAAVFALWGKALKNKDVRAQTVLITNHKIIHKIVSDSLDIIHSDNNDWVVRRRIAGSTDSRTIISKLSKDNDYRVREAVVYNKSTPLYIVDSLQNDSNEYVRKTATWQYNLRTKK